MKYQCDKHGCREMLCGCYAHQLDDSAQREVLSKGAFDALVQKKSRPSDINLAKRRLAKAINLYFGGTNKDAATT